MPYIDLSVTLDDDTPVYPGDPPTQIEPAGTMEREGWTDHRLTTGNHTGTHIDAPLHMIAGGKTLGQIPLGRFIGRGRLIDVRQGFTLQTVQSADIEPGDIVLFYTGMNAHYHEPVYFETYPVMSAEIAQYLIEHKVKLAGVDASSVDNTEDFPVHKQLLHGGVLVAENLANLDQLVGKDFTVYALPIKLDIDAAPARIIAEIN
ncbi:MAG TPA: cyclase family protein [Candidatus Saccharimonadales bacterium]